MFAALLGLYVFDVVDARAAVCVQFEVCQLIQEVEAVFEGTVESIEVRRKQQDLGVAGFEAVEVDERWVRFRDIKSWKGEAQAVVSGGWGEDVPNFVIGRRYVVPAYKGPDGSLVVSCSGTKRFEEAHETLQYLRARSSPGPGGYISGRVLIGRGMFERQTADALSHARIVLTGSVTRSTVADASGAFGFEGLPSGKYTVSVVPDAGGPDLNGMAQISETVTLPDLHSCASVYPSVAFEGVIQGMVVLPGQTPISEANVDLRAVDPTDLAFRYYSVKSDHNGVFRFEKVPPGEYLVGVNLSDGPSVKSPYPITFGQTDGAGNPVPIQLGAGERRQLGPIHVRRVSATVRIGGQVLTPDGTPAVGAIVRAMTVGERDDGYTVMTASTKADTNGSFLFELFPNVTYELLSFDRDSHTEVRVVSDRDRSVILRLSSQYQ